MKTSTYLLFSITLIALGCQSNKSQYANEELTEQTDTKNIAILPSDDNENRLINSRDSGSKEEVLASSLTPCNIEVVANTDDNIDNLNRKLIHTFLRSFTVDCNDNVEFSEFSNEVLFDILAKYPALVAGLIEENDYNIEALIWVIESPLMDEPIQAILDGFYSLKTNDANVLNVVEVLESVKLKEKITFNQQNEFHIVSAQLYSDYPSSAKDTLFCKEWNLGEYDIVKILEESEPINGNEWHYLYDHLPCVYRGEFVQGEITYKFSINGGSWLTIEQSDTIITYGDDGQNSGLFLSEISRPEEE